jgi:YD repeat-containing protein
MKIWLRPEPEPSEGGMIGFRRQLLLVLGACIALGVWFLVPWATADDSPTLFAATTILIGLALGVFTVLASNRHPRTTSIVLSVGGMLLIAAIAIIYDREISFALMALPILTAGLLLGHIMGMAAGIAAIMLIIIVSRALGLPNVLYWSLFAGMATGIAMVTGQFVFQVDYWERALVMQQRDYIDQLRQRQGELNRALKALDDAYESLKRANSELASARVRAEEARVLKEQFVANVSHELRTPLNLIVGFVEMIYLSPEVYQGAVLTPTLEGDLQEVYRASRHLQSLVNDILDLSRIDASRLPMFRELQDLRPVIKEAVDTVRPLFRQRGLFLDIEESQELPALFIDRTRIRQVLLNLFNNAARYTDRGGVRVTTTYDEQEVTIGVHDTGAGIPANQLEIIFEQFRQADPGRRGQTGAGLGLSLSRQFVRLHGGRMWAESTLDQGSSFYFTLPLPGTQAESPTLYRTPDRRRIRPDTAPVLILDPDPSIADMLSRYLGDRLVITVDKESGLNELVAAEHPVAIVVNLPPDAPDTLWLAPPSELIHRYGVPLFRCSIPSPSWLRYASTFDEVLTKPVSAETITALAHRHANPEEGILIVDDDPGFVRLIRRTLEMAEWQGPVDSAYSGQHALRLAVEKPPRLVFLDLLMPEMDGFEVLKAMRQEPELLHTRIVAVTATSYAEEALRRMGSRLTLTQSTGLTTGTVVELLHSALNLVRPNYIPEGSPPETEDNA